MSPAQTTATHQVGDAVALGLLRGMLDIPSPSYEEAELAVHLVTALRELGFATHRDGAGNLVAEIGDGEGPSIMLIGHLDTVPGQAPVRVANGRLYGRGAVDAKGPLATMICAALAAAGTGSRITVVGAVEEETPRSRGALRIRATRARPDYVIVGEPSGWSSVVLGYQGKLDLRYRVGVPSTHSSNPAPKASELAVGAWQAVLDELGHDAGLGSFGRPGPTLESISGDMVHAMARMSIRTPLAFDGDGFVARLRERLVCGELTVANSVAACRTDRRDPVVRALSAGIRTQRAAPSVKLKTGTSDMNTLAEAWTVPMATYGPGDSALDHSDHEHIVLGDYFRAIRVLAHALTELAGP